MKRLLALLLCLVMALSLFPAAAAEEIEIVEADPVEVGIPDDPPDGELIDLAEPEAGDESVADGKVTYRALLIGQTYENTGENTLYGDLSVGMMETLLRGVRGGEGGSFTVTGLIDAGYSDISGGIASAFMDADDDDVSIFYYNGHGYVTGLKDDLSGALITVEDDGSVGYVFMFELAEWLDAVPGKVFVILDSCGAGACITNGGGDAALFGELAVQAFAERDGAVSNVGEMLTDKYCVLAAAPYDESSWALGGIGGEMTQALKLGAEGSMRADTNGDGVATLHELYVYIDSRVCNDQTTCVYPTNSSFKVFAKLGKPVITTQPKSLAKSPGYTAKFKVEASGASSYQWYFRKSASGSWNKCSNGGFDTATYSVKATAARNGYQYRCKVSNDAGYVYTNVATLTVKSVSKPTITAQPKSASAAVGTTVEFSVTAADADSYRWQYRTGSSGSWYNSTLSGCRTAAMTVKATKARNGYQYRCIVTNENGSVCSEAATLTVLLEPTITTQPEDRTAAVGTTVKFTVKAANAESYQWYYRTSSSGSWAKSTADGAKTATLNITAENKRDGYQYRCKVSNSDGSCYSRAATLSVLKKPVISVQPSDKSAEVGKTVVFTVIAGKAESYQWYYRTSSSGTWAKSTAEGAATSALSVTAETKRDGYQYRCKVTNSMGSVYSSAATLSVSGSPLSLSVPASISSDLVLDNTEIIYVFPESVVVRPGASLTIMPGVQVDGNNHDLSVHGTLVIDGAVIRDVNVVAYSDSSQGHYSAITITDAVYSGGSLLPPRGNESCCCLEIRNSCFYGLNEYTYIRYPCADVYITGNRFENCGGFSVGSDYNVYFTNNLFCDPAYLADFDCAFAIQDWAQNDGSACRVEKNSFCADGCGSVLMLRPGSHSAAMAAGGNYWFTSDPAEVAGKIYDADDDAECEQIIEYLPILSEPDPLTPKLSKPTITAQPKSLSVPDGAAAAFSVRAGGCGLTYQWYYRTSSDGEWKKCTGADAASATLTVAAKAFRSGYQYRCRVSNAAGEVYSSTVTLTVK